MDTRSLTSWAQSEERKFLKNGGGVQNWTEISWFKVNGFAIKLHPDKMPSFRTRRTEIITDGEIS